MWVAASSDKRSSTASEGALTGKDPSPVCVNVVMSSITLPRQAVQSLEGNTLLARLPGVPQTLVSYKKSLAGHDDVDGTAMKSWLYRYR